MSTNKTTITFHAHRPEDTSEWATTIPEMETSRAVRLDEDAPWTGLLIEFVHFLNSLGYTVCEDEIIYKDHSAGQWAYERGRILEEEVRGKQEDRLDYSPDPIYTYSWSSPQDMSDDLREYDPPLSTRTIDEEESDYEYNYGDGDDGWILWGGGKCPVDEDALVLYRERDGYEVTESMVARFIHWGHFGASDDIIAYKVVSDE